MKKHYIISVAAIVFVLFCYVVSLIINSYNVEEEELPQIIVTHEGDLKDQLLQKRLDENFDSIISEVEAKKGNLTYDESHEISEAQGEIIPSTYITPDMMVDDATGDISTPLLLSEQTTEVSHTTPQPRYVLNAEPVQLKEGYTPIALIIDDLGILDINSRRSVEKLPEAVTMSFLPYGENTQELAHLARRLKHEVMIHLPMEAMSSISPGDNALYVSDTTVEISRKTKINLDALKDISVGVNNHMGSRFTSNEEGMNVVYPLVEAEGLMFLDSLTTAKSVVAEVAHQYPDTPFLKRHSFIDHVVTENDITDALAKLEKTAHKRGYAVAIGHPHTETLNVLEKWVTTLDEKKIQLVPITAFIK